MKKIIGSTVAKGETCFVPTPDGEVEVPVGTLIWMDGEFPALADKGGYQTVRSSLGDGRPFRYGYHTATIVAVPDGNGGWTVPGATPDATTPEWVPLAPEQVALLPDHTPVRVEEGGIVTEGALHRDRTRGSGVNLHHSAGYWWVGNIPEVIVRVHPEDVPDPDADLIERAARAAYETRYSGTAFTEWDSTSATLRDIHRRKARAILAVVRGEQA